MAVSHYTVNKRRYDIHLNDSGMDKNHLFDLSTLAILDVQGPRAAEFLQGQLSCDVREVNDTNMRQGSLCNLKGRILALMDVINWQEYHLVLPKDLIADIKTILEKTALVSRVNLKQNEQCQLYGFHASNFDDLLPTLIPLPSASFALTANDNGCCYALNDGYYLFVIKNELASSFCLPFIKHQQLLGTGDWHKAQLQQKQVQIYPETKGLFLPHRLNLHKSSYISFNKGCYKGQEIIARMHYRAKQKHDLQLFIMPCEELLFTGMRVFNPETHNEIGELIDFCVLDNSRYLLAISILHEHPLVVQFEGHTGESHLQAYD